MKRNWQLIMVFCVILAILFLCIYFQPERVYKIQKVPCFNPIQTNITGIMTGTDYYVSELYLGQFIHTVEICYDKRYYLPIIAKD